jgi:hypothetical protein
MLLAYSKAASFAKFPIHMTLAPTGVPVFYIHDLIHRLFWLVGGRAKGETQALDTRRSCKDNNVGENREEGKEIE